MVRYACAMAAEQLQRSRAPIGPTVGLVLPGGGARAAYQVGVLKAIAEMLPRVAQSVSRHRRHLGRRGIGGRARGRCLSLAAARSRRWSTCGPTSTCRRCSRSMRRSMLRSGIALDAVAALRRPAAAAAAGAVRQLAAARAAGAEHRLAQSAAQHRRRLSCARWRFARPATARPPRWRSSRQPTISLPWLRAQSAGATLLRLDHLMASLGVPFLFPPVQLGDEYYGDGAQRQLWPLSPAIHLGADRLLVIGVRAELAAGVKPAAAHVRCSRPRPGSCSATCSTRCSWTRSTPTSNTCSG